MKERIIITGYSGSLSRRTTELLKDNYKYDEAINPYQKALKLDSNLSSAKSDLISKNSPSSTIFSWSASSKSILL